MRITSAVQTGGSALAEPERLVHAGRVRCPFRLGTDRRESPDAGQRVPRGRGCLVVYDLGLRRCRGRNTGVSLSFAGRHRRRVRPGASGSTGRASPVGDRRIAVVAVTGSAAPRSVHRTSRAAIAERLDDRRRSQRSSGHCGLSTQCDGHCPVAGPARIGDSHVSRHGHRPPTSAGPTRPALNDHGGGPLSPESTTAQACFRATAGVTSTVANCASGLELRGDGFAEDVTIAAELDSSDTVAVLSSAALPPPGRNLATRSGNVQSGQLGSVYQRRSRLR
jgi:hypothetical protein